MLSILTHETKQRIPGRYGNWFRVQLGSNCPHRNINSINYSTPFALAPKQRDAERCCRKEFVRRSRHYVKHLRCVTSCDVVVWLAAAQTLMAFRVGVNLKDAGIFIRP